MGQGISLVYVAVNKAQLDALPLKGPTTFTNLKEDQTYWAREVASVANVGSKKSKGKYVIEVRVGADHKRLFQRLFPEKPDIVGLNQPVYSVKEFMQVLGECRKAGIEAFDGEESMCDRLFTLRNLVLLLLVVALVYCYYVNRKEVLPPGLASWRTEDTTQIE